MTMYYYSNFKANFSINLNFCHSKKEKYPHEKLTIISDLIKSNFILQKPKITKIV